MMKDRIRINFQLNFRTGNCKTTTKTKPSLVKKKNPGEDSQRQEVISKMHLAFPADLSGHFP